MKKRAPHRQYASLPYTVKDGRTLVMLITSRETRRWIIPKGWAEKGVKPHVLAAREAFEEAGLRGRVDRRAFGTYQYEKRLTAAKSVTCVVDVFLLAVEQELDDWPEKDERERRWMTPAQAAMLVTEGGLVEILLRFGAPRD